MSRIAWISLSAALVLPAVVLAVVLLAGRAATEPSTTGTTSSSPGRSFSLPLVDDPSALALAKHSGNVLVGLAAKAGGPVEIAVLRAETPVATDALDVQVDGRTVEAAPCGRGCSRIDAPVLDGSARRLAVRTDAATVLFELPARLPPTGASLFARAQKTMDGLQSFRFSERLTSGSGGVKTDFDVQAPNRLRFRTANGFRSVIIGRARWDFHDGRWERGSFPGLDVAELLMWKRAKHPRIVARRENGITELAAFGVEPVPAWFRLAVEPTGRVVEAEMIAASHFMVHRYRDFNGRLAIKAPR